MLAHRRSDRGSILLIAIVLVVVVMGMAGSYLVISNVQSHRVSEQIEADRARNAAESGVDDARVYLLGLVDPTNQEDLVAQWDEVLASGGVPDWSVTPVSTGNGSYSVVIKDNRDEPDQTPEVDALHDTDYMVMIESTGSANGANYAIRTIVYLETYEPSDGFALLTGGDLTLHGASNATINGDLGSVHSNGNMNFNGSPSLSGVASASGTVECNDGYTTGDPPTAPTPNTAIVPIPPVDPAQFRPFSDYILTATGQVLSGTTGLPLFDFVTTAEHNPQFNGLTWTEHPSPSWGTVADGTYVDGTYYVEGDITINHGGNDAQDAVAAVPAVAEVGHFEPAVWVVDVPGVPAVTHVERGHGPPRTVIDVPAVPEVGHFEPAVWVVDTPAVAAIPGSPATPATPWKVTIVATGDITTHGNPRLTPYYNEAELFVAGGDVKFRGTGSDNPDVQGIILAHEQVDFSGNYTFHGRVVAEAATDRSGTHDPEDPASSSFGGSGSITYNDELKRSFVTAYRIPIRSWNQDLQANLAGN